MSTVEANSFEPDSQAIEGALSKIQAANALPPQHDNEVELIGEAPAPILWRGKFWAVTDYGLERLDGTLSVDTNYFINLPVSDWLKQLSTRSNEFDDLVDALIAMRFFKGGS